MPSTDVHTHLAPLLSHAVEGVQEDGDGRLVVDGHRVGLPGLYDAQRLTRQLVVNGVDRAWVSAPPPFYRQGMEPAQTRFWVRALDDGLRARLAGESTLDRLTYLPFDQPEVALELAGDVDDSLGWAASAGGGRVGSPRSGRESHRTPPIRLRPSDGCGATASRTGQRWSTWPGPSSATTTCCSAATTRSPWGWTIRSSRSPTFRPSYAAVSRATPRRWSRSRDTRTAYSGTVPGAFPDPADQDVPGLVQSGRAVAG